MNKKEIVKKIIKLEEEYKKLYRRVYTLEDENYYYKTLQNINKITNKALKAKMSGKHLGYGYNSESITFGEYLKMLSVDNLWNIEEAYKLTNEYLKLQEILNETKLQESADKIKNKSQEK